MFSGYNPVHYKLFIWTCSAVICGIAGALYVPQVGIINPSEMSPGELDRDRDLGGGGRARQPGRARYSARALVNGAKSCAHRGVSASTGCTSSACCSSLVTLFLPQGVIGLFEIVRGRSARERRRGRRSGLLTAAAPRPAGASLEPGESTSRTRRILYLEDITVSFDGFKALNELSLDIDDGELRCIIGPNGAGKTTMMDVITGKTRPDAGTVFFGQTIDLTADRSRDRPRRHRPQVPEAHGVRAAQRVREPGAGDEMRQARARQPHRPARFGRSATASPRRLR